MNDDRTDKPTDPTLETDGRFPSGPWRGYFRQAHGRPGQHGMDLDLTFRDGEADGRGRDYVGKFLLGGTYDLESGECLWTKTYPGSHSVSYRGFNEGRGVWGTWDIPPDFRGGFHVWPAAWGESPNRPLTTAAEFEAPASFLGSESEEAAESLVGVGGGRESEGWRP